MGYIFKIITFFALIFTTSVYSETYMCINVRYSALEGTNGHAFLSILKDVSPKAECNFEIGCDVESETTYSIWGSSFRKWKMYKDLNHSKYNLGDDIVLDQEDVTFLRHCELIDSEEDPLMWARFEDATCSMDNFNNDNDGKLRWGYYYGATQYNCTTFSVDFFNSVTDYSYKADGAIHGVETPPELAKEIWENIKKQPRNTSQTIFEVFTGVASDRAQENREEFRRIRERLVKDRY